MGGSAVHTWQKWKFNHPVFHKACWSVLFVFIFILGKSIPLPYTDAKSLVVKNASLHVASLATGGDLTQLSLFSLGLSPWMSAMIIANLLTQGRGFGMDRLSERRKDWISKEITLLLTVIQGFVLVSSMQLTQTGWAAKGAVLLTMTTGTMFIMWLSNMNALLGIGGLTLLVLANILQSAMKTGLAGILMLADHSTTRLMVVVAALVIIMVLFAYFNVMADRGEYRLPLVRLMIDNNYASRSYLPIKLTPAGGMPIMFAMSMITLPTYFCLFLLTFYPQNYWLAWGATSFGFTKLPGIILYISLLFTLSLAFALVNVNAERQAKAFQRSGDYLLGVRPGKATERRINRIALLFGVVGGVYNVIFAGMPMLMIVSHPGQLGIYMLPGYVLMIVGFSMGMIDQINILSIRKHYRPLFDHAKEA